MKRNLFYIKIQLTILFYLVICNVVFAENSIKFPGVFHCETILPAQGLPTDELFCIYQDHEGFMWFGTADGICRWDGYQVKVYKSNYISPALLPHNQVNCILEDHYSNLWIGSQFGLAVMNKSTGQIKHIEKSLLSHWTINCLLEVSPDEIWIGTESGINKCYVQNTGFTFEKMEFQGLTGGIKSMIKDTMGDIWIGTWSGGISRYDVKNKKLIKYPPLDKAEVVTVLFEDKNHNIWVGSWNYGLYRIVNPYDPKYCSYRQYSYNENQSNSLSNNTVFSIEQDDITGYIWVGTYKGLCILTDTANPYSFIRYNSDSPHEFNSNDLCCIYKDKAGIMWLAFSGYGIKKVQARENTIQYISLEKLMKEYNTNSIHSIYEYPKGTLWLGTKGQGIFKYNLKKKTFDRLEHNSQLGNEMNTISCISYFPGEERLWAASSLSGVYTIEPFAAKASRVKNINEINTQALPSNVIHTLFKDKDGKLWIGGRGLVIIQDKDTISFHNTGDRSVYNKRNVHHPKVSSIVSIIQDHKSRIWLGTENNGVLLAQFKNEALCSIFFKDYNRENKQTNNNTIQQVYEDQKGRIWIGTKGGGLSCYDEKSDRFVPIDDLTDFPGDVIMSIMEDKKGNLWLSTNNGIVCYNPELEKEKRIKIFSYDDGINDIFFVQGSHYKNEEGVLFFGGNNGILYFNPENIYQNDYLPKVVITDFKIFNHSIELLPDNERNSISSALPNYSGQVTLKHNQNDFTVEFSALSYSSAGKNRYAYKLEGVDKEWQYVDSKHRYASYRNIPFGQYKFSIIASNESGIWNKEAKKLLITILPPFYLTWWAKLIYVILLLGLIYFITFIIRRRVKIRNTIQLQQMENAHIQEINKVKLEFFTNVSHEFLTPLTILTCAVDDLQKNSPEHLATYGVMKRNILRLMRLLQQIMEFRKAETGNLKLKVSYGNLSLFLATLNKDSFQLLADNKKIELSFETEENIYGWFDPDKLDKIIYNLISNAFKYNHEGGSIDIRLQTSSSLSDGKPEFIIVSIRNTGEGIPEEQLPGLFKRFYEGNYRKFKVQGIGIGLSLTKDLVELHPQGEITVESKVGQYTEFTFRLPIARSYFSDSQVDGNFLNISESDNDEELESDTKVVETDKPLTILIVEDNSDLLTIMKNIFKNKYHVITAADGKEGVDKALKYNPNIIVSDILMPTMDGFKMTKILKSDIRSSHIPIIIITAKVDKESKMEGYHLGADLYIPKPFDLDLLDIQIENLLNNRKKATTQFGNTLNISDLKLNFTTLDEQFMQKAITIIKENFTDPEFDMPSFQNMMAATSSMMNRKFKALTGMPPFEFVIKMRLEAAAEIMKGKQVGIAEIAYKVGFNDPKYFSKSFRKIYGVSPADYMNSFLKQNS